MVPEEQILVDIIQPGRRVCPLTTLPMNPRNLCLKMANA